jgi:hypothetical protein
MSLATTRQYEEEKEEKRRKILSVALTSFILAVVLLLLVLFGFKYLDPPPPEEGVMVSMGQEEGGYTQETPQQTATEQSASSPQSEESVETQDYEDAPDAKSNPTPTNPNTTPPNNSKKTDKTNKTVNSDLLFNKGDENTNNGDDNKDGNKGKEDGLGLDPNGGYGLGNDGTGWFMSGRKPETKISASCTFSRNETVVVKIKVDRNGKVISTDCVIKYKKFNATTSGEPYCKCAKQAASSVRFTPKADAPAVQEGAVKFDFKVK